VNDDLIVAAVWQAIGHDNQSADVDVARFAVTGVLGSLLAHDDFLPDGEIDGVAKHIAQQIAAFADARRRKYVSESLS
jgi:hypothetical protein